MCLLYALWLRLIKGGTIYLQFRTGQIPITAKIHFVVKIRGFMVHGTSKNSEGRWAYQVRRWNSYMRFCSGSQLNLIKLI